jgi:uncharacterized protein (DUF1330 family)
MSPHAYVILTSKVSDPELFKAYLAATPSTLAAHGGEYLVRGGAKEVLEGQWDPNRVVMLRFPSLDHARAWYNGEGYTRSRALRQGATEYFNALLVEGFAPPTS